jgi:hypothetical protein
MDRTPTPGQSDLRSKVPMGVVTRSRADTQLPHVFRDLIEECPRNWEVRHIEQLTPARQDRQWRFIRASRPVFDRIYREPESPKEVSQQATRTNPMGDQRVSPREFPGLQVDPALPLTLQERLASHECCELDTNFDPRVLSAKCQWRSTVNRSDFGRDVDGHASTHPCYRKRVG